MSKVSTQRPFFKKCRTQRATVISFYMPRLGVWQPFFCIRHCHKHDSTAFYQLAMNVSKQLYNLHYDQIFKISDQCKVLDTHIQEPGGSGFCVVLFTWIVDAYLYTLPYALESIWGKLWVGLTLIVWFDFALVYRKTIITNIKEITSEWQNGCP